MWFSSLASSLYIKDGRLPREKREGVWHNKMVLWFIASIIGPPGKNDKERQRGRGGDLISHCLGGC